MRFGIFYEHQLPRPWPEGAEEKLLTDALEQVELADRVGIDYVWEVEHHFLEEYSHSSAPEVFLAAASQRTKRIRLGHGIVQIPPGFNHPARVAERVATLDLISGGRVEFGTGESSSQVELGAFGVDREAKRAQWEESLDVITRMFCEEPFQGYDGQFVSMPPRSVVPKPKQRPHPPLWVACSRRETILLAAKRGIGALTFAFVDTSEAKKWVDDYYATLKNECVPIGHTINPNICMVTGFSCHADEQEAIKRGLDGFLFFGYGLGHHYIFGEHKPGRTSIWERFEQARKHMPTEGSNRGIGTPRQLRDHLRGFADAGVDQVTFIQQAGRNKHEHICESLELFSKEVMAEFHDEDAARQQKKMAELAPYMEAAMKRKQWMKGLEDDQIPTLLALGRQITEVSQGVAGQAAGGGAAIAIPLEDPANKR